MKGKEKEKGNWERKGERERGSLNVHGY